MPARRRGHEINLWAGRLIPLIILGSTGYIAYVVTVAIGVDYLLRPRVPWIPKRTGAGIAIIVVEFVPTLLVLLSYFRFLSTLLIDPGFVARGSPPADAPVAPPPAPASPPRRRPSRRERAAAAKAQSGGGRYLDRAAVRDGTYPAPPGLERFYRRRDVFTCGSDGLPRFCNTCWCWKPDRAHHSGELQRCVRRYDHYCPWVGGGVSETNNKFFLQFATYGTLYAVFVFVVNVWIIVRSKQDCDASPICSYWSPSGHWIVGVVMAGMFGFMGFGIAARFAQFAATNTTTVEMLQRGHPATCFAVRVDPSELPRPGDERAFFWVRYPFGPDPPPAGVTGGGAEGVGGEAGDGGRRRSQEFAYFAILQPRAGVNPWDVGGWANWRGLMGPHFWDWFLPFRSSPSVVARRRRHARRRSRGGVEAGAGAHLVCDFPLGKDFEELERAFLPHRYRGEKRVVPLRAEEEEKV